MSLGDAITFRPGTSSVHGGIIAINAIGKPGKFGDTTGFGTLEPLIQGVSLALFEQDHKVLAQVIGE